MPNYIAGDLGGIAGSGVYQQDTRPKIDVGGIIDSISKAYQNTKEGVLQRAVMQAQNARANQELAIQAEQHQLALRQSGALPPEEVLGRYGATSAGTAPATANATPLAHGGGAIAAAINGSTPGTAPQAPPPVDSSLQGAPPPGRIIAPPATSATTSAPGALATPPGDTAPAAAHPTPPLSPSEQAARDGWQPVGGTGPNAHWLINPARGTYTEQRESLLNRHSLLAANDAYAREHPGAPPLYTDAEIETGSRNPKAFAQLVNRSEGVRQAALDRQQRFTDLDGAMGADGKPLTDVQRRAIANDPIAFRNFIGNPAVPQKESPADRLKAEEELHKHNRMFDATHPVRGEGENPTEKRIDTYVTRRVMQLTASQPPKFSGGHRQPGLDFDTAQQQALQEAYKLYGNHSKGTSAPPTNTPPASPATATGGNDGGAQADFAQIAAKYQHAIQLGIPGDQARQAYDTDVLAVAKKHGMVK